MKTTRSKNTEQSYKNFVGFDVNHELRNLREAIRYISEIHGEGINFREKNFPESLKGIFHMYPELRFVIEAITNIDEYLCMGNNVPRGWQSVQTRPAAMCEEEEQESQKLKLHFFDVVTNKYPGYTGYIKK